MRTYTLWLLPLLASVAVPAFVMAEGTGTGTGGAGGGTAAAGSGAGTGTGGGTKPDDGTTFATGSKCNPPAEKPEEKREKSGSDSASGAGDKKDGAGESTQQKGELAPCWNEMTGKSSPASNDENKGPWNADNAKGLIAQSDPDAAAKMTPAQLDEAAQMLNKEYAANPNDDRNIPESFGLQNANGQSGAASASSAPLPQPNTDPGYLGSKAAVVAAQEVNDGYGTNAAQSIPATSTSGGGGNGLGGVQSSLDNANFVANGGTFKGPAVAATSSDYYKASTGLTGGNYGAALDTSSFGGVGSSFENMAGGGTTGVEPLTGTSSADAVDYYSAPVLSGNPVQGSVDLAAHPVVTGATKDGEWYFNHSDPITTATPVTTVAGFDNSVGSAPSVPATAGAPNTVGGGSAATDPLASWNTSQQLSQGSNSFDASPGEIASGAKTNNINGLVGQQASPANEWKQSAQLNNGATFGTSQATKTDYVKAASNTPMNNISAFSDPVAKWNASQNIGANNVSIGATPVTAADQLNAANGGQNINGGTITNPAASWGLSQVNDKTGFTNPPGVVIDTQKAPSAPAPAPDPAKALGHVAGGAGAGLGNLMQNPAAMAGLGAMAGMAAQQAAGSKNSGSGGSSGSGSSSSGTGKTYNKNDAATSADSKGCYYTMSGSHVCPASKTTTVTSSCFTSGSKTMCPVDAEADAAATKKSFTDGFSAGYSGGAVDTDRVDDPVYVEAYDAGKAKRAADNASATTSPTTP